MQTSRSFPQGRVNLSSAKTAPLGESDSAVLLENSPAAKVAFLIEVVEDRGVDGGEFLQTSDAPKPQHGPLSSPKRQVRILEPVV